MHENITKLKEDLAMFIEQAKQEMDTMKGKLPPQKIAAIHQAHESTIKRLTEIQLHLEKRRNMKRAAIEKRHKEAVQLLEVAKRRMKIGAI